MKQMILIVDDDETLRRVMSRLLKLEGYEVSEAGDGYEALEIVPKVRPDLVLLDINMPRLDGMTTLGAILRMDPKMPVIIMAGDGDEAVVRASIERGACDFVAKPVGFSGLTGSIAANLSGRPLEVPRDRDMGDMP